MGKSECWQTDYPYRKAGDELPLVLHVKSGRQTDVYLFCDVIQKHPRGYAMGGEAFDVSGTHEKSGSLVLNTPDSSHVGGEQDEQLNSKNKSSHCHDYRVSSILINLLDTAFIICQLLSPAPRPCPRNLVNSSRLVRRSCRPSIIRSLHLFLLLHSRRQIHRLLSCLP